MLTIKEISKLNFGVGHHFFSKGAMDAFNSVIESEVFLNNCFITSEDYGNGRLFKVRRFDPETCFISTVEGNFPDIDKARDALKEVF